MSIHWFKIIVAAIFEVGWVIGLKHADHVWAWIGTGIAVLISFYLMIMAARVLPVGTVYAVFVGLGTAGTVVAEVLFFHEPIVWKKMMLIALLLTGIIGLKVVTQEKQVQSKGSEG